MVEKGTNGKLKLKTTGHCQSQDKYFLEIMLLQEVIKPL